VILYRCFAWNERTVADESDGALWFPRVYQGDGRHDNPDAFGCLYLADRATSCVVEQLARFRGQRLTAALLRRRGLPLALAEITLADDALLLDLDEPVVLRRERLRPSQVATRDRATTQPQARRLHDEHPTAAGLRWWSIYEAQWVNVTLFERAAPQLRLRSVAPLTIDHRAVRDAADFFGLRAL
jgi:hypothetical protein